MPLRQLYFLTSPPSRPPSYITVYLTLGMHDRTRWAFKLAPQLTGRAQQAYAALDPSNAECYNMVKVAILRCYNINDETYCQRFRMLKFKAGKTPTEIATRLTDLAGRWLKHCHTVEEVKDTVVKEQSLPLSSTIHFMVFYSCSLTVGM